MDNIPDEILEKIFSYLTLETLTLTESVCLRWSEIIVRRYFHPHLAKLEFSIGQHLERAGWSRNNPQNYSLNKALFRKARYELPLAWSQGSAARTECVLGSYRPAVFSTNRVTDIAVYNNKLYMAQENCTVQVRCLDTFALLTQINESSEVVEGQLTRSCQLVLHSSTLAVSCPARTKVRLYNTKTDEMVGEVESKLGPIYNIAISDKLLVCLSGWSLQLWSLDSSQPATGRRRFRGVFPDFQPTDEFSNWLEVHSAVTELVTRAMRKRTGQAAGSGSVSFLHVRRVGPDGWLGPVLRQDQVALSDDVVEVDSMTINDNNMLAILKMVRSGENLKYVITVMDVSTGVSQTLPTPTSSILGSVQMPVTWQGDNLYIKIVPKPSRYDELEPSDESSVSLSVWRLDTGQFTTVPSVQIHSSTDLLVVQAARLLQVSSHLLVSGAEDWVASQYVDQEEDNDEGPCFTIKAVLYDFWNMS